MIQIELRPTGAFSNDLDVLHDGRTLTRLSRSCLRERGGFQLAGENYELHPRGFTGGTVELTSGERVVASAKRASLLSAAYEIALAHDDRACETWTFRRASIWRSPFVLEAGGRRVGEVSRRGHFKRGARVRVDEDVPPVIALFFGYLAVTLWARQSAVHSSP